MVTEVHIVGYPRSGTVWLTRLMSDALDSLIVSPPTVYHNKIVQLKPIAYMPSWTTLSTDFCQTGDGGYVVYKTHLMAHEWDGVAKTVFIQRDPRDVAVSAAHYLNIPLWDVLRNMCIESSVPFDKTRHIYHVQGAYADFVRGWQERADQVTIYPTRYERLHKYHKWELYDLLTHLGLPSDRNRIETAISNQQFSKIAPKYPHSMRKGIVGDWQNHFDRKHGEMITEHLGELMLEQGYVDSPDWWRELSE